MIWFGIILMFGALIVNYFIVKEDWQPILWLVTGCFILGTIICNEAANEAHPQAIDVYRGKRMREAQKQWKDGDPFDGTEMELAKRMCEAEREVDEYLKKMEL